MFNPHQVRLDWDKIAYDEALKRVEFIKKNNAVVSIELRESPSGNGYHAIIYTYWSLNPTFIWRLRRAWKDDGFRLVKDVFNKRPFRDVLFQSKRLRKNGMSLIVSETKMFKCERERYMSEVWKNVSIE